MKKSLTRRQSQRPQAAVAHLERWAKIAAMDYPTKIKIAILIIIAAAAIVVWSQNKLAPLRERVAEALANVKSTVEKRNRLIKHLLEIASSYAKHERYLVERISADYSTPQQIALNPQGALTYISRLVTTFPELRADRTYLDLSRSLYALESELQEKHQLHGAAVRNYNSVLQSFPHDTCAPLVGYHLAEHLDGTDIIK